MFLKEGMGLRLLNWHLSGCNKISQVWSSLPTTMWWLTDTCPLPTWLWTLMHIFCSSSTRPFTQAHDCSDLRWAWHAPTHMSTPLWYCTNLQRQNLSKVGFMHHEHCFTSSSLPGKPMNHLSALCSLKQTSASPTSDNRSTFSLRNVGKNRSETQKLKTTGP